MAACWTHLLGDRIPARLLSVLGLESSSVLDQRQRLFPDKGSTISTLRSALSLLADLMAHRTVVEPEPASLEAHLFEVSCALWFLFSCGVHDVHDVHVVCVFSFLGSRLLVYARALLLILLYARALLLILCHP